MVEALVRCPVLHGESGREMLVEVLTDSFGDVLVLRGTAPRLQFVDLVGRCGKLPDGLRVLIDGVSVLDPLTPQLAEMVLLCDEWDAYTALPSDDWEDLRGVLGALRLADGGREELRWLRELAHKALRGRGGPLPSRCRSAWTAFLHLAGANAVAGSPPPAVLFLACLAESVDDPAVAERCHGWWRDWAARFQLPGHVDQAEWYPALAAAHRSANAYLVIQLDPDPLDEEVLMLSYWWQWDVNGWRPRRQGDVEVRLTEVEVEVDRLVGELETELGVLADDVHAQDIHLEFVLPWELLNTPVEFWRKSSMSVDRVPLAIDHPVVLRSLDRMRAARHRFAWRRRWSAIATSSADVRSYRSAPGGDDEHFTRLATELSADERIVSMVLSEPPGDRNSVAWREVSMAFRAGIPAILWDRRDCSSDFFRDAVESVLGEGGIGQLPLRVRELRRAALRGGGNHEAHHPGHSFALLWDDADRVPEPPGSWWRAEGRSN
ncbi:effector-associated domain 2-containing protein [Saccharothrix lopnurensis]|uniref:TIR domain-containing protein n=1 Tax=Saccharothrix lopnurensis TaxID=1670621 RepID=A0ABW1P7M2_9PSEU